MRRKGERKNRGGGRGGRDYEEEEEGRRRKGGGGGEGGANTGRHELPHAKKENAHFHKRREAAVAEAKMHWQKMCCKRIKQGL